MSDTTTSEVPAQESAAENNPNLNIQDLVNVLQVIGTCSQRGAFQAAELSSVGGLYDRIHAFLVATGAIPAAGSEQAEQPAASE